MSELSWSASKRLVYERAHGCCEYCQTAEYNTGQPMHVEHIDPSDLIAQADFQPKDGLYPTSVWTTGDAIEDCVTFDATQLPDYWKVAIGLYELPSGERLLVVDRDGHLLDNGMVVITP